MRRLSPIRTLVASGSRTSTAPLPSSTVTRRASASSRPVGLVTVAVIATVLPIWFSAAAIAMTSGAAGAVGVGDAAGDGVGDALGVGVGDGEGVGGAVAMTSERSRGQMRY